MVSASRWPAVKRLDSRTRVRRPSITAGIGLLGMPRTTKIINAASPGASALDSRLLHQIIDMRSVHGLSAQELAFRQVVYRECIDYRRNACRCFHLKNAV